MGASIDSVYRIGGQIDGMDDSILDEIDSETSSQPETNNKTVKPITIITTNARSLCPKIDSLVDCMEEMDSAIGMIPETWLADSPSLGTDIDELRALTGLNLIYRNRDPNSNGVAHGGVAIVFREEACSMKEIKLDNPDNYEIVAGLATLPGYSRKMIVLVCYLPPGYDVNGGRAAVGYIKDTIIEMKRLYRDPFIVVGGDFNQWEVQEAIGEFPDMSKSDVGPTRKDRCLD